MDLYILLIYLFVRWSRNELQEIILNCTNAKKWGIMMTIRIIRCLECSPCISTQVE